MPFFVNPFIILKDESIFLNYLLLVKSNITIYYRKWKKIFLDIFFDKQNVTNILLFLQDPEYRKRLLESNHDRYDQSISGDSDNCKFYFDFDFI